MCFATWRVAFVPYFLRVWYSKSTTTVAFFVNLRQQYCAFIKAAFKCTYYLRLNLIPFFIKASMWIPNQRISIALLIEESWASNPEKSSQFYITSEETCPTQAQIVIPNFFLLACAFHLVFERFGMKRTKSPCFLRKGLSLSFPNQTQKKRGSSIKQKKTHILFTLFLYNLVLSPVYTVFDRCHVCLEHLFLLLFPF